MTKRAHERHTKFLSVVFTPAEGSLVERVARRAKMKKSRWARETILNRARREDRRASP